MGPSMLRPTTAWARIGASTTAAPYMIPSIANVKTVSLPTVGDAAAGYRMVGIPDGLGAFWTDARHFTLLMNHEITSGRPGAVRAHGSDGALLALYVDPSIGSGLCADPGPGRRAT